MPAVHSEGRLAGWEARIPARCVEALLRSCLRLLYCNARERTWRAVVALHWLLFASQLPRHGHAGGMHRHDCGVQFTESPRVLERASRVLFCRLGVLVILCSAVDMAGSDEAPSAVGHGVVLRSNHLVWDSSRVHPILSQRARPWRRAPCRRCVLCWHPLVVISRRVTRVACVMSSLQRWWARACWGCLRDP
jgi:hypothetical protein